MRSYRTGKPIVLRDRIAESGEGVIYVSEPGSLAKLYHEVEDAQRFAKLKAMLERPPQDPTWKSYRHLSIAWPQDIVLNDVGRCAGFMMPHIQSASDLTHVYNPSYRSRFAPRFNWYYLHHAARNYASAVGALHSRGYVIGDIKPQNVLVRSNALITIVDADSFQVRDPESGHIYRCNVGSEGFTAPELLDRLEGRSFANVNRRKRHDRFGVGVIIYLLIFGRHPFSEGRFRGKGDPLGPDERIRKGLWAHTANRIIEVDATTAPLAAIHPELAKAFRQCFDDGHRDPDLRPRASQWCSALDAALKEMAPCARVPNHHYWRGNGQCLWCQRAKTLGIDVFSIEPPKPPKPIAPPMPRTFTAVTARPAVARVQKVARPRPASGPVSSGNYRWIIPLIIVVVHGLSSLSNSSSPRPSPAYSTPPTVNPYIDIDSLSKINNPYLLEPDNATSRLTLKDLVKRGAVIAISFTEIKAKLVQMPAAGYVELECTGTTGMVNGAPWVVREVPFKIKYPTDYDITGRNTFIGLFGQVYRKDLGPRTGDFFKNLTQFELDNTWEQVRE